VRADLRGATAQRLQVQLVLKDHAVRIADGDGVHVDDVAGLQLQGLVVRLAIRPTEAHVGAAEGGGAHLRLHGEDSVRGPRKDLHPHDAARRLHGERRVLRDVAGLQQVRGEDAQAVAALFRLGAVGVEDAQAEVGRVAGHARQDAVGAHARVPVADQPHRQRRELDPEPLHLQRDVVVAEPVAL
jgi:hypothetical protein